MNCRDRSYVRLRCQRWVGKKEIDQMNAKSGKAEVELMTPKFFRFRTVVGGTVYCVRESESVLRGAI